METTATNPKKDRWIRKQFSEFERMIEADGAVFNLPFMSRTAEYHFAKGALKGDRLICILAMASLTPEAGGPVQASDTLLAKRMTSLKKFFAFVGMVGSRRVARALGLPEEGLSWE